MIKIFCDICGKEPDDHDFAFEATITEIVTSLAGTEMTPRREMRKKLVQICKGCFYTHISRLLDKDKKNEKEK